MKFGFIGLGQVGSIFAIGLKKAGANVNGFDILALDPNKRNRFRECEEAGVVLTESIEDTVLNSEYIISTTSPKLALEIADSCKPYLTEGQVYIDLNSTVPDIKKEIEMLLSVCDVVDGAILGSPNQYGIATEIVFSGQRGSELSKKLNSLGMNIQYIGSSVGQAAALKVIRSIFTKGLEAVLIESLVAAQHYGVFDGVYNSIMDFITNKDIQETMNLMIKTNVIHAQRRAEEIEAVAEMLNDHKLDNIMSVASNRKLRYLAGLGLRELFDGNPAKDINDVFGAILLSKGNEGN